jgi:hypothetical protein
MKTILFVPFFTLPVDADVESRQIYEKAVTLPISLPQSHDHKVFHY